MAHTITPHSFEDTSFMHPTEKYMSKLFTALLICVFSASCTSVRYQPDEGGISQRGFRYYEPAWFILAYVNGDGELKVESLVLPDQTKIMSVDPQVFMAEGTVELRFKNGMLVGADENLDATRVPKAVIAAAEQVISAYLKSGLADQRTSKLHIHGPYLFKLVADKNGTSKLIGDGGVELMVDRPLPNEEKKSSAGEAAPPPNSNPGPTGNPKDNK